MATSWLSPISSASAWAASRELTDSSSSMGRQLDRSTADSILLTLKFVDDRRQSNRHGSVTVSMSPESCCKWHQIVESHRLCNLHSAVQGIGKGRP